jgi:hypothetical protein
MKKAKTELSDWARPEYKRSDFGKIVRGKYVNRIRKSTNVIVLDPRVAKVFPNDDAVNDALRELIGASRPGAGSSSKRKGKSTEKRRAA